MHWYHGFESFVREQVSLEQLTKYRVGGPAEFFSEPPDEASLSRILCRATEAEIPVRILGCGTNLLVADQGVRGLVVRLPKHGFTHLEARGLTLRVGAGYSLPGLVMWSVAQNLSGLECLVGVPGTVGAALRMNAGGKYGEIGARVKSVSGCEMDGQPFRLTHDQCGFVYRDSGLKTRIVTGCELALDEAQPEAGAAPGQGQGQGQELVRRIIEEKRSSQPLSTRSAGCVFKNPKRQGVPAAGKIIDDLGLKSLRVGGASVSPVHANFLICEKAARAADLAKLIRYIRQRVFSEWGFLLELEIAVWGLEEEELLPQSSAA